jgi:hypothetical protein
MGLMTSECLMYNLVIYQGRSILVEVRRPALIYAHEERGLTFVKPKIDWKGTYLKQIRCGLVKPSQMGFTLTNEPYRICNQY